jgi:hypothetical protein
VSVTEIRGVLDAHDSLVRECAEGRLTFAEFLGAYGDFPHGYGLEEDTARAEQREALRLCRKRVAFHRQVAGAISGFHGAAELGSLEDSGVSDLLPAVALMRLRELVARYPKCEARSAGESGKVKERGSTTKRHQITPP